MFNTITKLYNMIGEIIGIHTIKKKKCNKIYDGYTADDEKSDDFDNISSKGGGESGGLGGGSGGRGSGSGRCKGDGGGCKGGGSGEGSGCKGGEGSGYDDNTVMVDGLELILLKILKL
jgi:hypothetical protein